ncbi:MAG: ATP phosphoribosyltransferase regulatory subunit [Eggerthellaceae bacterium]|jgi:ATP phosphoribosyltransferase regulatory subunit|nr:ATP phosphoribosyltransferase regulatory subunit [Eggerthellaceae bacterium]MCH4221092.1 ATP phosphoribosyltransferase regulatory subunit [Eggerthellaceae bacterium]
MDFTTPTGFRDVMSDEARQREDISARVQACFAARGYAPIETPTIERMEVMRAAGHIPGSPFQLFDAANDLLALRPDVTMQIARMCATRLRGQQGPFKFRYTQRIFREADRQTTARELTQIGLENIGESGATADAELVGLFAEALKLCGLSSFSIVMGSVGVLQALLETCPAPDEWKRAVLAAYHDSNFVELDRLTTEDSIPTAFAQAIGRLPHIRGGREAIDQVIALTAPLGCDRGIADLAQTYDLLIEQGLEQEITVDFSIMSEFDYYTGIVFEAYAPGMGTSIGSGGRYDHLLAAYQGEDRPAAGFAFFLEQVMAACECDANASKEQPLRIAVPKGSLNADTIAVLQSAGLDTSGLEDPGRQLIISNPGVDYIIVRPTDAPVFVSMGAADCGICGKDSLLEAGVDIIELTDLHYGGCRFVVAEPQGATPTVEDHYHRLGSIRVATKYPRITRAYYDRIGMQVEIVKLHGNIELAPLTGMAERIVDITATGTTLRENNLSIVDDVVSSTARFFANTCAFRMDGRVTQLATTLQNQTKETVCDA